MRYAAWGARSNQTVKRFITVAYFLCMPSSQEHSGLDLYLAYYSFVSTIVYTGLVSNNSAKQKVQERVNE